MFSKKINASVIELTSGDITEVACDAIVNAANSNLIMGGGVAGAIRRKGGSSIQRECDKIRGTAVGTAVITNAGRLKASYVIHAVGPQMGEGDEDRKLQDATLNAFALADKHKLTSIAFPAISTGIFGFPLDRCAHIMLSTVITCLQKETHVKKVIFCLYNHDAFRVFEDVLGELFP